MVTDTTDTTDTTRRVSKARSHAQEEEADHIAGLLVGGTIEALAIELHPSGDNELLLQVSRKVYNDKGDLVTKTRRVRVQFNELGMWAETAP